MDSLGFILLVLITLSLPLTFLYVVLKYKGKRQKTKITDVMFGKVIIAYLIDWVLAFASISILYGVLCAITNYPFDIFRAHAFETILASTLGTTALMCSKLDQQELSKI